MKKIIANTFTPIYDEIEDRIRLVINYQDLNNRVDLMITRAFILNLIPATDEFIMTHFPEDGLYEETPSINTIKPTNFDSEKNLSKTDGINLELYKTDEELLREVNFSHNIKNKITTIKFSTNKTITIANLDYNMLKQITKTIKSSLPYFKWGISSNF